MHRREHINLYNSGVQKELQEGERGGEGEEKGEKTASETDPMGRRRDALSDYRAALELEPVPPTLSKPPSPSGIFRLGLRIHGQAWH